MSGRRGRARERTRRVARRGPVQPLLLLLALLWPWLRGAAAGAVQPAPDSTIDLTGAVVLAPPGLAGPAAKAVAMLGEEVAARSWVRWARADAWPAAPAGPTIVVGPARALAEFARGRTARLAAPNGAVDGRAEGYRVWVERGGRAPVVYVAGNDARGVLFGVGHLLRALRIERERVTLPANLDVATAPRTPLRGHQLGYRDIPNSYDGFTLPMWEQYVRDLAVFGTNAIELVAPDGEPSPNFPLAPLETLAGMSRTADGYGMDVWIWYPATHGDYRDPRVAARAEAEWDAVFRKLPRLDAVFVPGGDPGETPPEQLMPLLERQAAVLRRSHPHARVWVSAQGFSEQGMQAFLAALRREPAWLGGVVYGPWTRLPFAEFRAAVPARYPIRRYPDVTHTWISQYPVPDWDRALAVTQRREPINPRPVDQALIFRRYARYAPLGFITYSEGVNDDVNKAVWSALGWDPDADVGAVLRDYARYFVGPAYERPFADGLFALERNWRGPALANAGIDSTLRAFRAMEQRARREGDARLLLNWRFQMALYRAYFDAYVRGRLARETALEREAVDRLRRAGALGSQRAMREAAAILDRPAADSALPALRARVFELAEALFQSVRMQLSTTRYFAKEGRQANLDYVDFPLNDRGWLAGQFAEIAALSDEPARVARLDAIARRTDPGPGGFYDDLGDPQRRAHLVLGAEYADDPMFFVRPTLFVAADSTRPMAWWTHALALFRAPLRMRYAGLDPAAEYRVRVVYGRSNKPGERGPRLEADGIPVHPYLDRYYEPVEFDVPAAATRDGALTLSWYRDPAGGGPGRGNQVAEVWLMRKARQASR